MIDRKSVVVNKMQDLTNIEFLILLDDITKTGPLKGIAYLMPIVVEAVRTGDDTILKRLINFALLEQVSTIADSVMSADTRSHSDGVGNSSTDAEITPNTSKSGTNEDEKIKKVLDMIMDQDNESHERTVKPDAVDEKPISRSSATQSLRTMLAKLGSKTTGNSDGNQQPLA